MNAHRLNHHDIQAIKAFEDRARMKARANRLADCITMVGCFLALLALLVLGLITGVAQ
jgi:hypothetical protein